MVTNNAVNEATAASGTVLQGQGVGTASAFSTATYPATTTASQLLYSSATNMVGGLTTANNGTLVTSSSGVPSVLGGPGTTGNILQSNAAAAPSFSTSTYPATNAINTILYASSANAMSALATANGGVLATGATGVPSIDTTNFAVLSTGLQLKGNNTNTAPPSGFIGERIAASVLQGTPVSLSNATAATITSITLTAGIWDITAIGGFTGTPTAVTQCVVNISTTTNTLVGNEGDALVISPTGPNTNSSIDMCIPAFRVLLNTSTTYYLVLRINFSASTVSGFGKISAVRVG